MRASVRVCAYVREGGREGNEERECVCMSQRKSKSPQRPI